jgi:hypothetical protein
MTYLEAVNDVLIRLREKQVTTVTQTAYSSLIGKFINDAKKRVEDAFAWNALSSTIVIPTVGGTSTYTITGSGQRFKVVDVLNDTQDTRMAPVPSSYMNTVKYMGTQQNGAPFYYAFNGVDASGDTKVDVYPVPDGVYSLRFDLIIPQATLSTEATVILVPTEPIVQAAYALALAERGEDNGLMTSEASAIYRNTLSDAIAIEATRHVENDSWSAV